MGRKNNTQLSLLLVGDDGLHIESYCWDESTPKLVEHSHIACHLSRSEYICSFQHGYLVLFSTVCIFLFDIENAKLIATEVIPRFHFSLVPSASIHILDDRKSSSSGRFEIYLSDQNGVLFWSVELPQGKLLRITHFKCKASTVFIRRVSDSLCVLAHQLTITLLIGPIINPHVELLALKDSTSAVGSYRYLENFAQMRNMKLLLRIDDDLCVSLIDLVSRTVQRIVSDDASVLRHQFPSTKVPSFVGSWKLGTSSALGPCLDPVTARPFLCVYSYRTRKFSRLDHVPLAFFGAPIYFAEEDERYVVIWDKEIIKGCRKMTFWKF